MLKKIIILSIHFFFCNQIQGSSLSNATTSEYLTILKNKLDSLETVNKKFSEKIDVSVKSVAIPDLFQNIANASDINVSVIGVSDKRVTCNLKQISISNFILFLCKEYQIDVKIWGNIVTLSTRIPPPNQLKPLEIKYIQKTNTISYNFTDEDLERVLKNISESANCNIIIPKSLYKYQISGYSNNMSLNEALTSLCSSNSLNIEQKDKDIWYISRIVQNQGQKNYTSHIHNIKIDSLGLISINIKREHLQNILSEIFLKSKKNHFITNYIDKEISLFVKDIDIETLLKVIFSGSNYSWYIENGVYIIGDAMKEKDMLITKVIPMKYRSVAKVKDIIPLNLKEQKTIEVILFPDLNSIIVHGEQRHVLKVENFLSKIDKSVALVSMDIIIVDVTKKNSQDIGLSMGIGSKPHTTQGSISPGVDFSMESHSINNLINTFNGFGSINIGKVSQSFYLDLKLLEEDGKIILRSTPKLSTLNGHKASLISGEKKYYKESQTNIIGTQNPLQSNSYVWKSVEANLVLNITPYVSKDNMVTLDISIKQSEFTPRKESAEDSPPGIYTRSFTSIIKVKNEEMVLLGGIEKEVNNKNSKGLPFIARIPILKWIFGRTSRSKMTQKLNVFIKPTIIN